MTPETGDKAPAPQAPPGPPPRTLPAASWVIVCHQAEKICGQGQPPEIRPIGRARRRPEAGDKSQQKSERQQHKAQYHFSSPLQLVGVVHTNTNVPLPAALRCTVMAVLVSVTHQVNPGSVAGSKFGLAVHSALVTAALNV